RGLIAPQRSFADWIRQINGLRRQMSDDDYLASIGQGFAEAERWGTTTLANIESLPAVLQRLPRPPLRTWWFAELIDVQPRISAGEILEETLAQFQGRDWPGGFGLSPHAPYTASPELLRCAATAARAGGLFLTTHLGESREEMEMFQDGRGPLFELLQHLGRPMDDCGDGKTPLAVMLDRVILDDDWIVAHLNELTEEDFARLAEGPRFHIAHCPRSARYFRHRPFALERLLDLSFNICLGTDSLASNSSLSLFAEMQTLQEAHPWLAPGRILEMATKNSARALHEDETLGRIRTGFSADLIALPIENPGVELFEKIITWEKEVPWMMTAGAVRQRSS
ncbi:MAG TPA: amidohydrolase family protein, partial [Chthoniobacterales bacterium]